MADASAEEYITETTQHTDKNDDVFHPTVREKRPKSLALQRQSNVLRDSLSSDDGETNPFDGFRFDTVYAREFQYGERLAQARHERQHSIVDGLLCEIYDRWHGSQRDSFDSDTFTECSSTSEVFGHPRGDWERRHARQLHRATLQTKGIEELSTMVKELQHRTAQISARLIRQLKRKDRRLAKLARNCDIVTAIIQAASLKRRIDMRMKFSLDPPLSASAFEQWKDAMKAVARLPLGIPDEFRKKAWLNLADEHIRELKVDWEKTVRFAFNEKSNPDDNKLGMQIVKDLHRTGCTGFSGQENEQDRAVLKRVLLAYARWNKQVGYCQGFNMIAALLLDVMGRKEDDALKVMIYLIDHVLPDSYFDNNLRALSVDMAVFRDLLRWKYPKLSRHLDHLQHASGERCAGPNYEPPLTNVFTMQWFLTLFATCLPKDTVLRVWDSVLLEGSEILLRTALVIWGKLAGTILGVSSADEFYTVMGDLCQDLMDGKMVSADDLIKTVYAMAQFPFPQLEELREKYTYNITPFSAAVNAKQARPRQAALGLFSDDDDWDDEDIEAITCFTGIFQLQALQGKAKGSEPDLLHSPSAMTGDISALGPGAYGAAGDQVPRIPAYTERMTTDMGALRKQYKKLRQRQTQAHIILSAVSKRQNTAVRPKPAPMVPKIESPLAMNHLFIVQQSAQSRNRCVTDGPRIAPVYPKVKFPGLQRANQHGRLRSSDMCRAENLDSQYSSRLNYTTRERTGSVVSIASEYSATSVVASEEGHDGIAPPMSPSSDKRSSGDSCESAIMTECLDFADRDLPREELKGDNADENSDSDSDASVLNCEDKENIGVVSSDLQVENECKAAVIEQTSLESNNNIPHKELGHFKVENTAESSIPCSRTRRVTGDGQEAAKDLHLSTDSDQQRLAEDTAMYVYQVHKRKQTARNSWSSSSSNSQPGSPTSPSNLTSPLSKLGKPFNPFPVRLRNQNRVQTGVKLGLYTPETLEQLENKVSGTRKSLSSASQTKSRTNVFGLR